MTSFVIDSKMFRDQDGTEEMRQVFSDESLVQKWLDSWVALAEAERDLGIVPEDAARHIKECAKWENIDMDAIRKGFFSTSHPLMPQIREFERVCGKKAGGFIHWGATTQDIMDTAVVLQIKAACAILEKIALVCLIAVIAIGFWRKLNVGILAIAIAVILGYGSCEYNTAKIVAGYSASLFITLFGLTMLFGIITYNGCLEQILRRLINLFGRFMWLGSCPGSHRRLALWCQP